MAMRKSVYYDPTDPAHVLNCAAELVYVARDALSDGATVDAATVESIARVLESLAEAARRAGPEMPPTSCRCSCGCNDAIIDRSSRLCDLCLVEWHADAP